jgi:hypothetical protein
MAEQGYSEWKAKYDAEIAVAKAEREKVYGAGNVWTTDELQRDFEVLSFLAPTANVQRKSDGVRGYVYFDDGPRVYYRFFPNQN